MATSPSGYPTPNSAGTLTSGGYIIGPGDTWPPTTTTGTVYQSVPVESPSQLELNATKKLVCISMQIEELFEYKYRLCPAKQMCLSGLTYSMDIIENTFGSTTPVASLTQEIIAFVQGDCDDNMRPSEQLHAAASMLYAVMMFRKHDGCVDPSIVTAPPSDHVNKFIYDIAKSFVFDEAEMPEEAFAKLALLDI